MSYETKENSQSDGEPFECYEFTSPIGTFRYTSLPSEVTLGGNTYVPTAITRGSVVISMVIDTLQTVDFQLPLLSDIAQAYLGSVLPDYLTVRVYRGHVGETDFVTEWYGESVKYSIVSGKFVIKTQSVLQAKVLGQATTVYTQYGCNNKVYDARCKALKSAFTQSTEVVKVDNYNITVLNQGYDNDELQLGTMISDRTGEERTIQGNTNQLISITYPFFDIVKGDTVKLVLGCDNRMATCRDRFDNVANYTGFRYMPLVNPFSDVGGDF